MTRRDASLTQGILRHLRLFAVLPFLVSMLALAVLAGLWMKGGLDQRMQNMMDNAASAVNAQLSQGYKRSSIVAANVPLRACLAQDYSQNLYDLVTFYGSYKSFFQSVEATGSSVDGRVKLYGNNPTLLRSQYIEPVAYANLTLREEAQLREEAGTVWSRSMVVEEDGTQGVVLFRSIFQQGEWLGLVRVELPGESLLAQMRTAGVAGAGYMQYEDGLGHALNLGAPVTFPLCRTLQRELINGHLLTFTYSYRDVTLSLLLILAAGTGLYLLAFALVGRASRLTAQRITEPLHRFMDQLDHDQQSLLRGEPFGGEDTAPDEVGLLKRRFAASLRQQNRLYRQSLALERRTRALSAQVMQATLNPHLLYNALSLVKWSALDREDRGTAAVVDLLVRYYRNVLNRGALIFSLRQEAEVVAQYLEIVGRTNGTRYELQCLIPAELLEIPVPKLLLQPLVENAVMHGFVRDHPHPRIRLLGERRGEELLLTVEDNGCGMEAGAAQSVSSGYGLASIAERIGIYYGPACGLAIYPAPEGGTRVVLTLKAFGREELARRLEAETEPHKNIQ